MEYSGWELKYFDSSNNFRKYQFRLIKEYIGKKLLEIGPGTGVFAKKFFLDSVEDIYLSEINVNFNNMLVHEFKNNKKVKILSKKIEDIDDTFDTICYFDVLEHINFHEKEIINSLKKIKKGGHLIVMVPAFNYLFSYYDKSVGHYRRYEKKFFIDFAKANNLTCKKLIYFDSIGFFFLLINKIVNTKKKDSVGLATILWNILIPLSKILDKITLNSFGKSLLCIIKK